MLGMNGLLSNHVHPTPHVVRELFDVRYEGGEPVATLARDLAFHERLAKLVIVPFYNALTYVMSYHGWALRRHPRGGGIIRCGWGRPTHRPRRVTLSAS